MLFVKCIYVPTLNKIYLTFYWHGQYPFPIFVHVQSPDFISSMFNDLNLEVVVRSVNIGRIVNHHRKQSIKILSSTTRKDPSVLIGSTLYRVGYKSSYMRVHRLCGAIQIHYSTQGRDGNECLEIGEYRAAFTWMTNSWLEQFSMSCRSWPIVNIPTLSINSNFTYYVKSIRFIITIHWLLTCSR
jgi:hypothetical protein